MKLTGDLKKKVEESTSREAKKAAIADAGMLLDDAELDQVTGGEAGSRQSWQCSASPTGRHEPEIIDAVTYCKHCHQAIKNPWAVFF